MKTTTLGRTDIEVSRICLGTMTWGTQNSEAEGHAQMDYALAHGVTFWDTAEMYPIMGGAAQSAPAEPKRSSAHGLRTAPDGARI